jgi:Cu(I)/Ag(I) efflux system membrane fusion protein
VRKSHVASLWIVGALVGLMGGSAFAQSTAGSGEGTTPLYYRDPAGRPSWSAGPRKDAQGRAYLPVFEDVAKEETTPRRTPGKVIYYRHPMGLADTSPVPKKDSMGMDYIPVTEEDANAPAGSVSISPERVQMLGVRTEAAVSRRLSRVVRATGAIGLDESRLAVVAPRFEGWIETIPVNSTGQLVRRGQVLFEAYSPELALTQAEFATARRSMPDLAGGAVAKLRNLGIAESELERLTRTGVPTRTQAVAAPIDGIVLEKTAILGMRFAAGEALYRIADMSVVWLIADIFEQDIGAIAPGATAKINIAAYPGVTFAGEVSFVYPTVNATTRTTKVRVVLANPDGRLRLDMYAFVEIDAPAGAEEAVIVPESAVLDGGARQVVLVEAAPGRFLPRDVTIGSRANGAVEIKAGLKTGERVVISANFLIDAESNLRAALQAFTAPPSAGGEKRP